ncbi:hypothetical protein D3C83_127920 [compost metagenome]
MEPATKRSAMKMLALSVGDATAANRPPMAEPITIPGSPPLWCAARRTMAAACRPASGVFAKRRRATSVLPRRMEADRTLM